MSELKSQTPAQLLPPEVYWEYINLYHNWQSMVFRCHKSKSGKKYDRYRGRGITVCDRWLGDKGFDNFLADMGLRPSPKHSLDRINVHGNYEPENCRWATNFEQARNRTNNRLLTVGDTTATLSEWCEISGLNKTTVVGRLKRGYSVEDEIFAPKRGKRFGAMTERDLADKLGTSRGAIRYRLHKGWTLEQIISFYKKVRRSA